MKTLIRHMNPVYSAVSDLGLHYLLRPNTEGKMKMVAKIHLVKCVLTVKCIYKL